MTHSDLEKKILRQAAIILPCVASGFVMGAYTGILENRAGVLLSDASAVVATALPPVMAFTVPIIYEFMERRSDGAHQNSLRRFGRNLFDAEFMTMTAWTAGHYLAKWYDRFT